MSFVMLFFSACQKELYFDYSGSSDGSLLAELSFECKGDSIHGNYYKDSSLSAENYIDVIADVTIVGQYQIFSDTVNGIYFRGDGVFQSLGLNTVRLRGYGTPINSGFTQFKILYNSTYCHTAVFVENIISDNAVIDFQGQPNTCSGAVLNGTSMQGLSFSSNNTATINISVVTPGNYSITTPMVNGVSYTASGYANLGDNTIVLTGSGTPTLSGIYNYPVVFGNNTCTFSVNIAPAAPDAVFSIPSNCNAVVHGLYDQDVPVDLSDYVTISVNVTTPGSYHISTDTVNGVFFANSGIFSAPGPQIVTLYASGTPQTAAPFSFNYSLNNGCGFPISVTGDYIICNIDSVFTTFNVNASAGFANINNILSIGGSQLSSSNNPSINIQLSTNSGGLHTDSVNVNTSGILLSCDYFNATSVNYLAMTGTSPQSNPFTLIISAVTTSTPPRIKGRFYGPVKDNGGSGPGQKTITEGYFDLPLN